MLVLSRVVDEVVMIGDDIQLTVVDIRSDKARLGFDAPGSVTVHRKEVYEAIKRERLAEARFPHSIPTAVALQKPVSPAIPAPKPAVRRSGGMLVLSRQVDETIMIGDDIEVTVIDIRGDKVRLGITAPKEITVHRKEVHEAIKRENRAAAANITSDTIDAKGKKLLSITRVR